MRDIILWGAGKSAQKLVNDIRSRNLPIQIVAVVDTAPEKQGQVWNGYRIQNPQVILDMKFDKIITPPSIYDQVCRQLLEEIWRDNQFHETIMVDRLDNCYFLQREAFLCYYKSEDDFEKKACIEYVKNNPIGVFNYKFAKEYRNLPIPVYMDEGTGLYYVYYKSKRMYLSRTYDSIKKVKAYIRSILMEQDVASPHKYLDDKFTVEQDSIVLDAGVAEGNFALEIIDQVKKIYLVETEPLWIEALRYTFMPYGEKVIIIQGFLSDKQDQGCVTIDEIMENEPLDFIKMDIEGAETAALRGGKQTLFKNNLKLAICSYHREDDYQDIKNLLHESNYNCNTTQGYMTFIHYDNFTELIFPKLVHGIIRAQKKIKKALYIWGAGKNLEIVYKAINLEKAFVKGIIDQNLGLQGTAWDHDILIGEPKILQKEVYDYVLISAQSDADIYKNCIELGIDQEKIFCFWRDDRLIDILDYNIRKMNQLERLIDKYQARLENYPYEIIGKDLPIKNPIVKTADELMDHILNTQCSLCRFGDGEFELMRGKDRSWFQHTDSNIEKRLREVFYSNNKAIVVAIADNFGDLEKYTEEAADAIRMYLKGTTRQEVMKLIGTERVYYDAYISRPYMIYRDKDKAASRFQRMKELWKDRNVLIVEGRYTKMGVANDLLGDARSVRRILCPSTDAFYQYSVIKDCALKEARDKDLVLISLGATATILAYDMALSGIQALDIGQIDNEYEWFLKKADRKTIIEGKMTAESCKTALMPDLLCDKKYIQQIVAQIE